MRNKIPVILILVGILAFGALATPLNVTIKKMHESPAANSKVVYEFPIDIILLDVSDDLNWFKVRIKFEFAFIRYDFTGWVNIPVNKVISPEEYFPNPK